MSGVELLSSTFLNPTNHSNFPAHQPHLNTAQNQEETYDLFIPPVWSKNNNKTYETPQFIGPEGPTSVIENLIYCSPVTVFNALFNDEIWNLIVFQTNLYAQQIQTKTGKSFTKTNLSEIKTFIGINLLMGIKKQCSYRDYWSSSPDLHDSYISSLMPVNRFSWLLSHVHLNDNTLMPKRNSSNYDKLYKIRSFITILSNNFQAAYNPHQIVAVDESMVKFTGRNSDKQYMPKKTDKTRF